MASSIFGDSHPQPNGQSTMSDIISSFGTPQAAFNSFAQTGARCTLPNGQQVTIQELANMVQGKSPQQVFAEFGLDPTTFLNFLR